MTSGNKNYSKSILTHYLETITSLHLLYDVLFLVAVTFFPFQTPFKLSTIHIVIMRKREKKENYFTLNEVEIMSH